MLINYSSAMILILQSLDKRVSEHQIVVLKIELLNSQPNPDSVFGGINVALQLKDGRWTSRGVETVALQAFEIPRWS